MHGKSSDLFGGAVSFYLIFCTAVLTYAMQQVNYAPDLFSSLRVFGSDDAMRLVEVRDLLAGQGWFDTVQYRALPPEGVSIHWSRYIDAPLVGLNLLFGMFTAPDLAEKLAAAVWPALLFILYLTLVGRVTRAVFGTSAACFAMIAASLTPMITANYFAVGRVDHHNVQIFCMFSIFATMLVRGNPLILGAIAGVIAAFSLAIGLETVIFIAVAGVTMTILHVIYGFSETRRLFGFSVGMGLAAPVLFIGQTAPAEWFVPRCDQLSWPFLTITTAAAAFGLVAALAGRLLDTPGPRLAMAFCGGGLLAFLLYSVLAPCAAGPYADLPEEVRLYVIGRIIEALPAIQMMKSAPAMALLIILPIYTVAFLTMLLCIRAIRSPGGTLDIRPLSIVMLFLSLGVAASFVQVRGLVMALAVFPIAFGVAIGYVANLRWRVFNRVKPIVIIFLVSAILVPHIYKSGLASAMAALAGATPEPPRNVAPQDFKCNKSDILSKLDALPPSMVMAPVNMGANIILQTRHSVTAVPYHRRADAMANGVLPFLGTAADMEETVQTFGADLVLVCRNEVYGTDDSMGSHLAKGDLPPWLARADIDAEPLQVLRVLRDPDGQLKSDAVVAK